MPEKDTLIKNLVQKITGNGYILESEYKHRSKGLALGNPLSPCLANLYLDAFDEQVKALDVRLIRYADDFIILCKSPQEAESVIKSLNMDPKKEILSPTFFQTGWKSCLEKQLVITEPYIFLGLSGELVVIKKKQIFQDVIPVRRVSEIIVRGDSILSAALIRRCIECDIPLFIRLTTGYTIPVIKPGASGFRGYS